MRRLLGALAVVTVAGFVAYDFRDRLPDTGTLKGKAAEMCEALPKPGLEGRYQNYPACPWNVRVGSKQVFSGIILPTDHGAWFRPDDNEPGKGSAAWLEQGISPNCRIWADERADRSLHRLKAENPRHSYGAPQRVKLSGWRLDHAGQFGSSNNAQQPDVLFVDEYISIAPESPEG